MHFEGEKGEHFFRSTLVQTLFYGVFSAWVLWRREQPAGRQARASTGATAAWYAARADDPQALFDAGRRRRPQLGPLGLVEVLDWTGAALNRVDRAAFFATFDDAHAVQYFYEPFLRGVRPRAAQGARRLVHAAGDRPLHGRPRRHGAARGAGHRRRPRRPARLRARPLLRHRRAIWSRCWTRSPRRCARRAATRCWRPGPEAGRHGARLRLRDPARAVRGRAPADRPAAAAASARRWRRATSAPAST